MKNPNILNCSNYGQMKSKNHFTFLNNPPQFTFSSDYSKPYVKF